MTVPRVSRVDCTPLSLRNRLQPVIEIAGRQEYIPLAGGRMMEGLNLRPCDYKTSSAQIGNESDFLRSDKVLIKVGNLKARLKWRFLSRNSMEFVLR